MSAQAQPSSTIKKSFTNPDEVRTPPKARVEVVNLGGTQVMRATFEPGWKWSESVKPIAGTESCQVAHLMYQMTGRMIIRMDDGTEYEIGPGDTAAVPAGHDAWVIGDEPVTAVDFQGAPNYAKTT
jgi:quercetin dioxygenase-like cupin family protein